MESSSDTKNDSVIYVPNWIYTYLCVCVVVYGDDRKKTERMDGWGGICRGERERGEDQEICWNDW